MSSTVRITAEIPNELYDSLVKVAKHENRPLEFYILEGLKRYLYQHAMIQEGKEEATKGEFISHEAVERWAESLGTNNELPLPEPDIFKKG